jgi:fused signal recognition particle receptor
MFSFFKRKPKPEAQPALPPQAEPAPQPAVPPLPNPPHPLLRLSFSRLLPCLPR